MHIYRLIPRKKHVYVVCDRERSEKPQKVTQWSGVKNGKSSKKTKLSSYQSIDKNHFKVHVKFEVVSSIPFTRKINFKK
jgi:hypothetical protein